jgi:hypothetical protein
MINYNSPHARRQRSFKIEARFVVTVEVHLSGIGATAPGDKNLAGGADIQSNGFVCHEPGQGQAQKRFAGVS